MKNVIRHTMLVLTGVVLASLWGGESFTQGVDREHLNLGRRPGAPYSSAVRVGNTLYLAGRTARLPETGRVPDDVEREVRIILDGMKATLEAAGMSMDDLVAVQVFCSDITLYQQFNAIYRTYFSGEMPARAFIGSGPLLWGARFEVMGTAAGR